MELNVHELINMPGYGKASEAVQKAGMWDDLGAENPECKPFCITVDGYAHVSGTVFVWAESIDAAMERALSISRMHSGMTVVSVEIEEAEEANT